MPGEATLKFISIPIEGIEKNLVRVIWAVVETMSRTGREMPAAWLSSPVRSDEVLTTMAVIETGVGEDVDIKFEHLIV